MRSPRSRFEFACRVGVFVLLGWLLGASVIPTSGRRAEIVSGASLESRLASWTRLPSNVALHTNLDVTPSAASIDWLAALRHSGHSVTWTGSPPPLAVSTEPVADPRRGTRIDVATPAGLDVTLRDDAGVLASLRVGNFGASLTAPVVVGRIAASVRGETASVRAPDTARIRSVVVVGSAGWEGKFVVTALEERGWPVIARFAIAPGVDVGQRASLVLDTARVAAVIAVDTTLGGLGGAIERYVRMGGGLILSGPSSLARSIAAIAPGALGARFRPAALPADTIGLGATGFYPVMALGPSAIALERRAGGVSMAARRVGAGRVIQVGYDDSWRWRMAGAPGSDAAHRLWWSRLVSSVAYAPLATSEAGVSAAPVAAMIARIGPPRPLAATARGGFTVDHRIYMILMMILLLAEWGSRRLRGLR
jgi:hypothetical protein